jgi:hypothetical protein
LINFIKWRNSDPFQLYVLSKRGINSTADTYFPVYDLRAHETVAFFYKGHTDLVTNLICSQDDLKMITSSDKHIFIRSTQNYF